MYTARRSEGGFDSHVLSAISLAIAQRYTDQNVRGVGCHVLYGPGRRLPRPAARRRPSRTRPTAASPDPARLPGPGRRLASSARLPGSSALR